MKCTYVNEKGENVPMVMGCYGIGVTRTLQSIVEQYHDEAGIKWPLNVAPYHAVIVPISSKDEVQVKLAEEIHNELEKAGVEVILDDRDAKPGFKFKDWELIGIPYIITVGRRANEGIVEFKLRSTMEKTEVTKEEALKQIIDAVKSI
jgi:prolyl-tRNA synthetase